MLFFVGMFIAPIIFWVALEFCRRQTLKSARVALYHHDFAKALSRSKLALSLPFLLPTGRVLLNRFHAQLLMQMGAYQEALRYVDSSLAHIARRPSKLWGQTALSLLNLRAACLESLGRIEEAEKCRHATLDVWASIGDPEGAGTFEAAIAEQQRGEYGLAMERMKVAIERSKTNAERAQRKLHLAMMEAEVGRFDQAIEEAKNALDDLTDPLRMIAYLGIVDWSMNEANFDIAEEYLIKALALSEHIDLPRLALQARIAQAEVMFARGQQYEALQRLDQILNDGEFQWSAAATLTERLYWMGHLHEAAMLFEEAKSAMEVAPNITPDIRASMAILASQTQLELGNLDKASEWIEKAFAVPVKRPRIQIKALGISAWIAYLKGDQEKADRQIEELEQVCRMYQDAPIIRSMRGFILGRWHLLTGNAEQAEQWLNQGMDEVRLSRDLPPFFYYLGEAKLMRGNEEGARKAFRKAAELGFEHLYATRAFEKLQSIPGSQSLHTMPN